MFGVMKRGFGFTRLRYKGLSKNEHYLLITCALVNMVMAKIFTTPSGAKGYP